MRNIEDIAAEEEARIRGIAQARLRTFLFLSAFGLSLWGWNLFRQGQMGKGALIIMSALICWGASWGILKFFNFSFSAFFWGLLAALPPLGLYLQTRIPSFYWGKDPSFWLSVQAGAVGEPSWSPLSYLLGQAVCFLFPQRQFSILPEISGIVLAAALFLAMVEFFLQLKNKTIVNILLCLGLCWSLAVCLPFWNIATLASGLPAALGLLLFLIQKVLLNRVERPWPALYLLLGMMASVHPLWGLLGLMIHLGSLDFEGKRWGRYFFPLLAGLTPYLWILFRAGQFFPSWGGLHPFKEFFQNWKMLVLIQGREDWEARSLLDSLGWIVLVLMLFVIFLWCLNFFKWKVGNRSFYSALYFWAWVLSGVTGVLFFSVSSETMGPLTPAFLLGLGEMSARLLDRGSEKRHATFFSGSRLSTAAGIILVLVLGFVFLPGQRFIRSQLHFPLQHALNLLRTAPGKSILIFNDSFEAEACREARLIEPMSLSTVILEKKYLNQKWYITQCIGATPELLFSGLYGSSEEAVKSLVLNNRDEWAIHWALSVLPDGWKEPKAHPTVLTQQFEGKTFSADNPESVQYRFDLALLPRREEKGGGGSARYLSRYVAGFNEMGKKLMAKGFYMAAIHAFDRSLKLDPSYSEPQSLLAQMYSQQNILEAARLEFEKTIKNHPQRINVLMTLLEKAQKEKDEPQSVTLLDEMIRLNSELADAQYQLSVIYNRQGKTKESKELLESSVRLNPKQIEAQMTMGHLMARMGNRIKAEEAFRAVLGVNPQNKEAQVELWKLLNK